MGLSSPSSALSSLLSSFASLTSSIVASTSSSLSSSSEVSSSSDSSSLSLEASPLGLAVTISVPNAFSSSSTSFHTGHDWPSNRNRLRKKRRMQLTSRLKKLQSAEYI